MLPPARPPRARRRLACAFVALSLLGAPRLARAAPEGDDTAQREAARAKVKAANEAFRKGRYEKAIGLYEEAQAIRPAAKLHYNIAVCHERLMEKAKDKVEKSRRADLAIESYNNYLVGKPDADDRSAVTDRVRELGGTPATRPGLTSPFDRPDGVAEPPQPEGVSPPPTPAEGPGEKPEGGDPPPEGTGDPEDPLEEGPVPEEGDPTPSTEDEGEGDEEGGDSRAPVEPLAHGKAFIHIMPGLSPQMLGNEDVEGAVLYTINTGLGLFAGKKRRALLGLSGGFVAGGNATPERLAVLGGHLGATADLALVLGKRWNAEFDIGVIAGYTRQSVRAREMAPVPICSAGSGEANDVVVGARNGGLFGSRISIAILLGRHRLHQVMLNVQPEVALYGPSTRGENCMPGVRPLEALNMPDPLQFTFWAGAGYGVRF